jgi:hypothetical protein
MFYMLHMLHINPTNHVHSSNFNHCFVYVSMTDYLNPSNFSHLFRIYNPTTFTQPTSVIADWFSNRQPYEKWPAGQRGIPVTQSAAAESLLAFPIKILKNWEASYSLLHDRPGAYTQLQSTLFELP